MNKTLDEMKMIHEEEMQSYGRIQDRVISVMLSHGCKIVQTPSFEDYDSYGTYFPSLRKEMIKTIDSDGSVLVLRPDVTLPLVKAAAIEFPDGSELLKYGYVTTVFRNYYGMTSHGRDFLQAGVDVQGIGGGQRQSGFSDAGITGDQHADFLRALLDVVRVSDHGDSSFQLVAASRRRVMISWHRKPKLLSRYISVSLNFSSS